MVDQSEGTPKRVALYARCSTKDKGQNPETQLLPLRHYTETRGFRIFCEYVDVGYSGSKERRPELDRMMEHARKGRFDVLMVARFDRFARSTSHLLRALEEFKKLGIDFVSLNESIDTSTAVGKLVFTILGAVAEMERALIQERVKAGVDRAKKQGKKLGRPRALCDKHKVYEEIQAGESLRVVAARHGIGRGTVERIVRDHATQKDISELSQTPTRY